MAATLASTITALEGSVTRPVREAFVDWARRAEVNEARESSRRAVIALLGSVGLHPEPEAIAVAPIFVAPFRSISEDSRQRRSCMRCTANANCNVAKTLRFTNRHTRNSREFARYFGESAETVSRKDAKTQSRQSRKADQEVLAFGLCASAPLHESLSFFQDVRPQSYEPGPLTRLSRDWGSPPFPPRERAKNLETPPSPKVRGQEI